MEVFVTTLLGLYYGITIAIVSFATAMTVLTLNIHHGGNSGREVPAFIRTIINDIYLLIYLPFLVVLIPPSGFHSYHLPRLLGKDFLYQRRLARQENRFTGLNTSLLTS